MASKLTNFGDDGVWIFQGDKNGVIPHLKEKHAPFMLWVHYVAHQTNLVIQTFSKLPLISKIEALLKFKYNYYCAHPKHVAIDASWWNFLEHKALKMFCNVKTCWTSMVSPTKQILKSIKPWWFKCFKNKCQMNLPRQIWN